LSFLRALWLIARKDLVSETRTFERLSSALFLALIILVVFSFAFDFGRSHSADLAAGALWVTLPLAVVLSLHESFRSEREDEALSALRLAPLDDSAIYAGKLLSNLLLLMPPAVLVLLLCGLFFNLDLTRSAAPLALVVSLNALGFAALGTLFAALSSRSRRGETLLYLLLLPLAIPLVLAAVRATTPLLEGRGLDSIAVWLRLTLAMDLLFVTAGTLLFEYLAED
jgi:heme exporter protein B